MPSQSASHPGKHGTILYFGRLSREKGVQDLLSAADRFRNLQFVIAGAGPIRCELESAAAGANLRNAQFVGHVSGEVLRKRVEDSQVSVFPSRV